MLSVSGDPAASAGQRKLAAILVADVAGFSRLMGEDEAATYEALSRLRGAIDPVIGAHKGRLVSTAGDGLLADFVSVVDAVSCAVEMQAAALRLNEQLPATRRLELRIGVNLGDVIMAADGDLFGDGVNIAARLEAHAAPAGICLSQTAYDQVRNKLALDYRPLGALRVKNIKEPVRAYAVGGGPRRAALLRLARRYAAPAAAGIVIAAGAGVFAWRPPPPRGREAPAAAAQTASVATLALPRRLAERTSVAVLPFANRSPDASQDFFADGITEDIINALGRYSNLLVAASSASFQFKGRNVTPEQAGRRLRVRYLVDGSVSRSNEQVRIAVELIDASAGIHLWSRTYNVALKDIFSLQDTITKRIVGATAVRLTQVERQRVMREPTRNLAAYEYVLRARAAGLANPTRAANDAARTLFKRAIALDPNYAQAYAALGWTYYEGAVSGWTEFPADDTVEAETLAQKALAIDPTTTDALRLLADLEVFRRHYNRALAYIDRALAINPSDAATFLDRGHVLLWSGKPAEAVTWLEAALRLDGSSNRAAVNLGVAEYFLRRYDDAIAALGRSLERDPSRVVRLHAHAVLAAAYARLGRAPDAKRERALLEQIFPFFGADRFAAQFGTKDEQEEMLTGLHKAGFR